MAPSAFASGKGEKMLSFYTVSVKYCDYLRKNDACVSINYDKKEKRPYIGILFEVDGKRYFAPLSSPKPKHRKMKNGIDFLKINNGLYGAINFNNMIPVPEMCIHKVDIMREPDSKYKNLLQNQLTWCNKNEKRIMAMAQKLYYRYVNGTLPSNVRHRCCNFSLDETMMDNWDV